MDIINPNTPLYNTIIFYILIIGILLIIKPDFMYCKNTQKFKPFGFDEGKTIACFPTIVICSAIFLYIIFMFIKILYNIQDKKFI